MAESRVGGVGCFFLLPLRGEPPSPLILSRQRERRERESSHFKREEALPRREGREGNTPLSGTGHGRKILPRGRKDSIPKTEEVRVFSPLVGAK